MIKSKQLVETLKNTTKVLFHEFTQVLNTSITTAYSNLWRNEMTNAHTNTILFEKRKFGQNCNSLPFGVTCCTTRCQSLYQSLSLVVIRCHLLYHSLSLDVSLVYLFINDHPRRHLLVQIIKANLKFLYEICSMLTIKTPVLVSLLLTLNKFYRLL